MRIRCRTIMLQAAAVAAAFAVSLAPASTVSAAPRHVLLRGATLIDGTGAAPRRGVDVLVKDDRIEAVGAKGGTVVLDRR